MVEYETDFFILRPINPARARSVRKRPGRQWVAFSIVVSLRSVQCVPNDRDVTYIDDLQDTASPGIGRLEPNSDQAGRAPRWRLLEAR